MVRESVESVRKKRKRSMEEMICRMHQKCSTLDLSGYKQQVLCYVNVISANWTTAIQIFRQKRNFLAACYIQSPLFVSGGMHRSFCHWFCLFDCPDAGNCRTKCIAWLFLHHTSGLKRSFCMISQTRPPGIPVGNSREFLKFWRELRGISRVLSFFSNFYCWLWHFSV